MGWNDLHRTDLHHPLLHELRDDQLCFYFVHSYHFVCHDQRAVLAQCRYGSSFTAMVAQDNIAATQFHPEKSQDSGLQLLKNFCRWKP
jgi:glutamine amidotransferase